MTNKTTKRALLSSVMALVLCFAMLLGTTYAWFTDSVTSAGNKIVAGTLDVEMHWADGKEDPTNATWNDASTGAIFDYELWEPGYTVARHVKIANVGTLALKYQLKIVANGEVSILSDVIDVYYADPAVQVADRAALGSLVKLGTLTEVLAGIDTTASGSLAAKTDDTVTLVLKMQESAGNKYQDKSIGTDFSVVLVATQETAESDSFDNQYDKNAMYNYQLVSNAQQFAEAIAQRKNVLLNEDVTLDTAITIPAEIKIDLGGHTLSTSGLNLQEGGTIINGTVTSANKTKMTPHIKVSGGVLTMENVTVEIDDSLNYQASGNLDYEEFTGLEITNATAVLNDCNIYVKNDTPRTWSYVYGITANNANVTMNGGVIKVESAGAAQTDLKTAICGMGNSTVTLNNVNVDAETYGTTMGHLIVNTTDKSITNADFVSYGGTFELHYVD